MLFDISHYPTGSRSVFGSLVSVPAPWSGDYPRSNNYGGHEWGRLFTLALYSAYPFERATMMLGPRTRNPNSEGFLPADLIWTVDLDRRVKPLPSLFCGGTAQSFTLAREPPSMDSHPFLFAYEFNSDHLQHPLDLFFLFPGSPANPLIWAQPCYSV